MEAIKVHYSQLDSQLDQALMDPKKPWTNYLALAEEKLNVPRKYIFFGIVGLGALYLAFGYAAQFLCSVIGVAYPAYISMKALETKDKVDDTKWLTYWVTYAVFSCIEFFSGVLTSFIPFYWLLKCIFLVFCMAPIEQNGSVLIYQRIIRPYFLKHQDRADKIIDDISKKIKDNIPRDILKSD